MDKNATAIQLEHWANIFREWSTSGLNKTEFCRQRGIKEKNFFYYQHRIRNILAEQSGVERLLPECKCQNTFYMLVCQALFCDFSTFLPAYYAKTCEGRIKKEPLILCESRARDSEQIFNKCRRHSFVKGTRVLSVCYI